MKRWPALTAAALLLAGASGCGGSGNAADRGSGDSHSALRVFAAASLTATFTELADVYEQENPGTTVELNFAGSSDLVSQIQEGAPADVIATADEPNMTRLTDEDLLAEAPQVFVTNSLTIAVAPGNPLGISGLSDLAAEDITTVVCAVQVPCGTASAQLLDRAGVEVSPVSEENAVTGVLSKVATGQADAGLVYTTDAAAEGSGVQAVDLPESASVLNRYPISALQAAADPEAAAEFVDFILADSARGVFDEAGFGVP
ncbi:molybdate ABC transporter substrate-binding protein [Brevibacterium daeguense]|uniref:Molybdate ABC transporter substrate-binding protein n=1 Tax=Brevibacterium daeguense TaxID=909936 RepID=A0ABP8EJU5_9MICO|nr:molybdate ABC transporter substrate-binding protein [Brevibacterium daeguense]